MTETAFYALCATVTDKTLRDRIEYDAWVNAWSVETYFEFASDEERWTCAVETAKLMIDAPRLHFPDLYA